MKWITKTGEAINIKDMDKRHIQNAKRMLEQNVADAETALCQVDEEVIGSFTIFQTEEWIKRSKRYIKAFENALQKA